MKKSRNIRFVATLLFIFVLILAGSYFILNAIVRKNISKEISSLPPYLKINFLSVRPNIFSSSVAFDSLTLVFRPYNRIPDNSYQFYSPKVQLNGISFLQFVLHGRLSLKNLTLEQPQISLDSFLLSKRDSVQSDIINQIKLPFEELSIKHVVFKNMMVRIRSIHENKIVARGDLSINNVLKMKKLNHTSFADIDCKLTHINYSDPTYQLRVGELLISSREKLLKAGGLKFTLLHKGEKHVTLDIPELTIAGLNVDKLSANKFIATRIEVNKSVINIFDDNAFPKSLNLIGNDSLTAHADHFIIDNFIIRSHGTSNAINLDGSINLDEVEVNRLLYKDGYHFKSVQSRLTNIHFMLPDKQHVVRIKNIGLDSKKENIELEHIRIIPRFDREKFFRVLGHQADRIEGNIPKVEIQKVNVADLFHKKLTAEKINIYSSSAHVFRDRRYPRPMKNIPLPMEAIRALPIQIRVNSMRLNPSTIVYEEQPKEGRLTGTLRLERLKVSISPFINNQLKTDSPYIEINTEGSVMGSGNVHATVLMPVKPGRPYYVKGNFEKLELTKLNSSSENLGKIRIKSGFLDFLSFQFTMSEQKSTGKIIGAYHHLVIQQLKKHSDEKKVAKFPSFMLRNLIIPLNKPASLPERKRTGAVNYERDTTRFVSHYMLQSLLTGVKASFTLGFLLPK